MLIGFLYLTKTKPTVMKKWLLLFMITSFVACQKKPADRKKIETRLKTAMQNYLYKERNYDSSNVTYNVQHVTFFEDKTFFDCEFKVHMFVKSKNFDTTGVMLARISKDFSTVSRKY